MGELTAEEEAGDEGGGRPVADEGRRRPLTPHRDRRYVLSQKQQKYTSAFSIFLYNCIDYRSSER